MHRRQWMIVTTLVIGLFGDCGEGALSPGGVAAPLVGTYRLENRRIVAQDSSGTVIDTMAPPEYRFSLKLTAEGRYAEVDTVNTADSPENNGIFTEIGRWSTLDNRFFFESDVRKSEQAFSFDGATLILTLPDLKGANGLFDIVDTWRKIR